MALTDNIVGCWSPSVRGSGYLLPDLSGRGNHGTLTNMAGDDWVGASVRGVSGRVLDFDGTNDNIVITSQPLRTGDFTVSVWVYPRRLNVYEMWFGSADYYWYFASASSTIAFDTDSNITFRSGSGAVVTNVWQHFVAIRKGGVMRLYKDGIDQGVSIADTFNQASTTWYIGRWQTASLFPNALFGEVAVYNRALTAPEIAELYRRGNGALGRELTGQTRRRVYGFAPSTGARRRRILCGDYS